MTLNLVFKDNLAVLKAISRNFSSYSLELQLTELTLKRPPTWGFYRRDVYFKKDLDTERLIEEELSAFPNPQPNYFVTAHAGLQDEQQQIPEVVTAKLTSLRIVDPSGKVVGGYKVDAWLPELPPPAAAAADDDEAKVPGKKRPGTAAKKTGPKKTEKKKIEDEAVESFTVLRISGRGDRARAFVKLVPSNRNIFVSPGQTVGGWEIVSVDADLETIVAVDPKGNRKKFVRKD